MTQGMRPVRLGERAVFFSGDAKSDIRVGMNRMIALAATLAIAACAPAEKSAGNDVGRAIDGPRRSDVVLPNGMVPCDVKNALSAALPGVRFYPGSTVTAYYCQPANDGKGDVNRGRIIVHFESPAKAAVVRDWLRPRLVKAGLSASNDGTGLRGRYIDGAQYRITILDQGAGRSRGAIDVAALPVG